MASNLLEEDVTSVLRTTVERSTEELWLVDPTRRTIEAAVDVATAFDGSLPTIRLLAEEAALKATFEDFLVASRTADLIEGGTLSIRTLTDGAANSLVVADDAVFALVTAGDRVAALTSDDSAFVDDTKSAYGDRWEAAETFQLRTPPISRVRETLAGDIGEAAREDFDAVLNSLEANGDDELDEVTISLLIAARNQVLLYDISKWGEDVGIASKATFSRTKTKLEDTGLITTEKVPIDVGRPRLRLQLADERLADAAPGDFGRVVDEIHG
ncbi:hypothetical protein EGH24_06215 [Halonotius terrestris]|uniref:Transcriptional regulator n=1 Tax=Halonotius terrestris TaxID=2487750 RepID=A0A8J8PD20_9EURY|nr:DUF5821 family protein [Halonotius terrestris]TQQ83023.1 hypothetical protein EGH24_06215 [Halonotius terrestris]